jgi:hypothetical protein
MIEDPQIEMSLVPVIFIYGDNTMLYRNVQHKLTRFHSQKSYGKSALNNLCRRGVVHLF